MNNFISNSAQKNLKNRLIELISKSQELKFLVGFFYFSGIQQLYEALKTNKAVTLKVLVGLNVDVFAFGLTEFEDNSQSDEERVDLFFESVKKSLNTDNFDTEEFYEQVRFFIEVIRDGRLIIRKTYEPNHAKLYVFKLNDDQVGRNSLFITGSSNLTKVGLTTQHEFNVEISDYGVKEAEEYFDQLWQHAVLITEDATLREKLINLVEKDTLVKDITPFEAFLLVIQTYLDTVKHEQVSESAVELMKKNGYKQFSYQLDAASQALAIIKEHGGVVVADVVGLGKSVIASVVANSIGKRGVIICPPGLIGDSNKKSGWRKYAEEFRLHNWEIRSSGDLENIAEFVKDKDSIEVVIVDEAHRFRNEDIKDYEYLKNICRGRIVILLTATPFNNTPDDILSLLELFIVPKKSRITLEDNLGAKFRNFSSVFEKLAFIKKYHASSNEMKKRKAESLYQALFGSMPVMLSRVKERAQYLSKQIRDVIEPVTIRRNRLDLLRDPSYKNEVKDLSETLPPAEWFFELTKEQSQFYDEVLSDYFGDPDDGGRFSGAIYRPFEYERDLNKQKPKQDDQEDDKRQLQQQRNLFDFMRRLLVKRFESSFGAFAKSVENLKAVHEKVFEFIKKSDGKYILDRGLLEAIYDKDEDEIEVRLKEFSDKLEAGTYPKNQRIYDTKKFDKCDEFFEDIQNDINLFDELIKRLTALRLVREDPKAACLVLHIKEELKKKPAPGEPKRKILIFSEYADTVQHLFNQYLAKEFKSRVLVVSGDLSPSKIKDINQNFDAALVDQENNFDILISTDKISEGFNLNRAGMVVNYDIPWNPVRVIQRVGRINRISKKVFDKLHIINFFPTEKGASYVRSREIAQHKMFLIHNTLGEDARIFDADEEPTPAALFKRIQQNPEELMEESFYTKARRLISDFADMHPGILNAIKEYPARIKVAKAFSEKSLLVFIKKGRLFARKVTSDPSSDESIVAAVTLEEILDQISCDPVEKGLSLSGRFWDRYVAAKDYKEDHLTEATNTSLEKRAFSNIQAILSTPWPSLMSHLSFLKMLREDITDYGTLPEYTLRRITNFKMTTEKECQKTVEDVVLIRKAMGDSYLLKEKQKATNLRSQVIIAIENQKLET